MFFGKNDMELRNLPVDLFWDVDPALLDLEKHFIFIIERILSLGRPKEIGWLLSIFPPGKIILVVKKSRKLSKKTANYWALHFGIPKEDVACFKRPLIIDSFY